jgi:hypothetical protein
MDVFVHLLCLLTIYFLYFCIYGLFNVSVCGYIATRGGVFGGKRIGNDLTRIDHGVIYVQHAYFH